MSGQPCGAERSYSPGRLTSLMGHTQAAVPLTPLLAGLLLHTIELMHMERGGLPGGGGYDGLSADEQR